MAGPSPRIEADDHEFERCGVAVMISDLTDRWAWSLYDVDGARIAAGLAENRVTAEISARIAAVGLSAHSAAKRGLSRPR